MSRAKNSAVQIKVITDENEFDELSESWDNLVSVAEATVFQTYEWNRTWWKHFGAGKELHIISAFEEDQLVGLVPLFVDTIEVRNWKLHSRLRFIGASVSQPYGEDLRGLLPYSDYLDVIVHPDYSEVLHQIFADHLQNNAIRGQEILFEEVPEHSLLFGSLENFTVNYNITNHSVCPVITLEDSWDEYLEGLSGNSRYKVRKYLKKAYNSEYKIFDIERVDNWDEGQAIYERLVQLHQKRWRKVGYPGAFAEERYHKFLKEASRLLISKGWAELVVARVPEDDNELVAVDLIFKFKKDVSLVHRAFDIEANSSDESPGNVLLYDSVRDAITKGYSIFDFLRGAESYKYRSANTERENKRIRVAPQNKRKSLVGYLASQMIIIKRRLYLEYLEAQTAFQGKDFTKGVKDYWAFLRSRI